PLPKRVDGGGTEPPVLLGRHPQPLPLHGRGHAQRWDYVARGGPTRYQFADGLEEVGDVPMGDRRVALEILYLLAELPDSLLHETGEPQASHGELRHSSTLVPRGIDQSFQRLDDRAE